jgi:hypothetical protein
VAIKPLLLNVYHHRYAFFDDRFGLKQNGTFVSTGGLSDYRTIATEEASFKMLRRHFGDAVQRKRQFKSRGSHTHEWERIMVLPF